ncbi:hypothetical protein OJF2_32000 [Aquisphaera giovannonii]|uniref:Uncharacterized protein n=1 Tax=Aquisphaera giovannonii TaxID=406548 RepID=A0A5B9W334_9BACT|nr:hypothetical protein [Aquisphaera giovannonii]QEH34659.1 hypothetical protein OJF2_32000 [Aquisphaera giovannonii]
MAKNNRLSRDQKRKAKLKKRAERSRSHESLAYAGNKYKTAALTPWIFRTEVGIYESYVMSGGEMTDDEVEEAIEHMILRMRQGTLSPLPEPEPEPGAVAALDRDEEDLVARNIRSNWRRFAEQNGLPAKEDLIGVLRTILSSLSIWRSKNMHPQGYYRFLKEFMKDLGVNVQRVTVAPESLPGPEEGPPGADQGASSAEVAGRTETGE